MSQFTPIFVHICQLWSGRIPVMRLGRLSREAESKARALK